MYLENIIYQKYLMALYQNIEIEQWKIVENYTVREKQILNMKQMGHHTFCTVLLRLLL